MTFLAKIQLGRGFYQTILCVAHISVTLSVVFVPCELETPDLAVFSNVFLRLSPTTKNTAIYEKIPMRIVMLHRTGMEKLA